MLVRRRDNGKTYAMKMLYKEHVIMRNQVEHTMTERSVLATCNHPYMVHMNCAFQTPRKLYFVLEFCAGGELFFHLSRSGRFTEDKARFYASELLLVLEYLHSMSVIYRDLKPENVLLTHTGHVKLTDFGLSKEGVIDNYSAKSLCGTPEYLAPEILTSSGHGKAVDWYSFGALLYEMLTSLPPFYTRNRKKLFDRIKNSVLTIPSYLSPEAQSVLRKLLHKQPDLRLGSGPGDADDIKRHPYFEYVDFDAVLDGRVPPPFIPVVLLF
jgi:protein-serine/threonine kinase